MIKTKPNDGDLEVYKEPCLKSKGGRGGGGRMPCLSRSVFIVTLPGSALID